MAVTSSPASGNTYFLGEHIEATVTWDADVTWDVSASGSDLRVRLDIGGNTKPALLKRVGATTGTARSLVFRYTVAATDADTDGIFPKPNNTGDMVLLVGSATLTGGGSQNADRTHAALAADPNHRVAGTSTVTADAGPDQEALTGATVTLEGSGSSTEDLPVFTYAWTQPGGVDVTLSDPTAAKPTFTAPSVRTDLEFSLVVNDGTNDSEADTVSVAVRPPLNPTSAPCAHPAPEGTNTFGNDIWITVTQTTDMSISFRGLGATQTHDLYFCWPDGSREMRTTDAPPGHIETVSGLSSGTTHWMATRTSVAGIDLWAPWVAATTTGGASIRGVRFTSTPSRDADSDGTGDTYLIRETIQAEVTWSQPVTVSNGGDDANVSLRLDLGDDDNDLTNSRRKMAWTGDGSGTDTLTLEYQVQLGEMDSDGVWLQTLSSTDDTVVFLENGATVTGGNPATNSAVLTRAGLPTTGDAAHKVD